MILPNTISMFDVFFMICSTYFVIRLLKKLTMLGYHYFIDNGRFSLQILYLMAAVFVTIMHYLVLVAFSTVPLTDVSTTIIRSSTHIALLTILTLQIRSRLHRSTSANVSFTWKATMLLICFIVLVAYLTNTLYEFSKLPYDLPTPIAADFTFSSLPAMLSAPAPEFTSVAYIILLAVLYVLEYLDNKGTRQSPTDTKFQRVCIWISYLDGWALFALYLIVAAVISTIPESFKFYEHIAAFSVLALCCCIYVVVREDVRSFTTAYIFRNRVQIAEVSRAINYVVSKGEKDEKQLQFYLTYLQEHCTEYSSVRAYLLRKVYINPTKRKLVFDLTSSVRSSAAAKVFREARTKTH